jgi:hypothetical protein
MISLGACLFFCDFWWPKNETTFQENADQSVEIT